MELEFTDVAKEISFTLDEMKVSVSRHTDYDCFCLDIYEHNENKACFVMSKEQAIYMFDDIVAFLKAI